MKQILFIGAIRENHLPLGGEEYKNQLIMSRLKAEPIRLKYFDTYEWKTSPIMLIKLIVNVFLFKYDSILISASSFSTYKLLLSINFIRPNRLVKIKYLVVGGYFPLAIESGTFKSHVYDKLKCIIVQGDQLRNRLSYQLQNVKIIVQPNFKEFPKIEIPPKLINNISRFVFVGRISKAKGVSDIISAVNRIRKISPNLNFTVDFFGPKEEEFEFNSMCKYQGYLDLSNKPEIAYHTLSGYDCFLFPTTWQGEGFPGVIIDAYIAGLPVIATDWNMNTEIIKEGENGFIIPPFDVDALIEKMTWVMNHKEECINIGLYNKVVAEKYHINTVWPELIKNVL